MTGKLEIADDDGPNATESNQLHSYTFVQVDQSQDSQYDQNRKKKRKIKHKNKQQKHDTNNKNSRRPSHYFDFVKQKLDQKQIPSIHLAENEDDLSEEINDATQHMAQNLPEDEEDYKDQNDPDWTDSTADSPRHYDEDDNVYDGVSDDHNICDAEWEERESIAEFEMIKEIDRLDRDLDGQEEEVLWAFMNSGSRIQTTRKYRTTI
ncbi:uncharacterized protein V1513DRAFT_443810 [Lipomyces chichibuensis]|uniref:uncharacterized protein n=1 Tax=Lipomyces chichibuensis TaxID=1546026 RepID=UPI003343F74B